MLPKVRFKLGWGGLGFAQYRLKKAKLDLTNADAKRRRPLDGLVVDWNVIHGFAIAATIIMIIFNIYAWFVINNYRKVGNF